MEVFLLFLVPEIMFKQGSEALFSESLRKFLVKLSEHALVEKRAGFLNFKFNSMVFGVRIGSFRQMGTLLPNLTVLLCISADAGHIVALSLTV